MSLYTVSINHMPRGKKLLKILHLMALHNCLPQKFVLINMFISLVLSVSFLLLAGSVYSELSNTLFIFLYQFFDY